ncbi:hypothetical protein M3231_20770 [Neobacillus mesonae]|nr:hypothetical protein [Neobacillus mesonae]
MKNISKPVTAIVLSFSMWLAACSNIDNPSNEQDEIIDQGQQVDPVKSQKNQITTDTKVDESLYEGEELELIKLVNLSVQYRNEGNEEKFKNLLSTNSAIISINKNEISDIEIHAIGDITDTQAVIEANVTTQGITNLTIYVFLKENGSWKIADID